MTEVDLDPSGWPKRTVRGHSGVRDVLEPFFAPIHENEFILVRRATAGAVEIHDAGVA